MFLYYQQSTAKDDEGNGESWKYVKDSAESRKALAEKQVHMVSMLAISNVQYDADYEQLKYRGDLYFDIDSDDLNISIASTQELVAKLRQFGVYDIVVYLSGKKGFHVTVPSKVFSQNTSAGIKWLPYIYGHMAFRHFAVEGLDPSVYSGGKGRLWRQPNVKRLDNGAYKVPVRPEDLEGMDAARYQELASKPNFELMSAFDRAEPVYSLELATAFEEALNYVKKEQESKEVYRFEVTPELEMLSTVPGCIMKLVNGIDVKDGANFNKAAMNLAGYLKSANRIGTDTQDELVGLMSSHNNYGSATYTNDRARRAHLNGAIRRAAHDRAMGCNPAYILSSVERCGGCVICDGTIKKPGQKDKGKPAASGSGSADDDGLRRNVFEIGLAYYKAYGPKTNKPLTTFILEPITADIYYHQDAQTFRREAIKCNVTYSAGEGIVKTTKVTIEEDAWDSPSLFKKQFKGIDNIAITASEDDLADLRHYIMSKYNDIDNSIRTATIGLDIREIPAKDRMVKVLTYTEPGFTASGTNIRVPVHYSSSDRNTVVGAPSVHKAPDLSAMSEDDLRAVRSIFNVNERWICATMVGWMVATSLKPHVMSIFNEFPLLAVTGKPGTGKTTVSCLMADLAGCTYNQTGEPASANSTQAFIERFIAGSTSTPRILDEANDPAFRSNPKLLETIKGVWNGLEMGKGSSEQGVGANIATRSVRLTGPLLYISEQPRSDDALRQRSIEVFMSMATHGTKASGEHIPRYQLDKDTRKTVENFEWMMEHEQRDRLRGAAKAIIMCALRTKRSWVKERLAHYAEVVRAARLHSRQKYSWRVILMGLDLYEKALSEEYDIDVSKDVDAAKKLIVSRLLDSEVTDTGNENCNTDVIQFIATMSERSAIAEIRDDSSRILIAREFEYFKTDDELKLDISTVWPAVAQFARNTNTNLKYSSSKQFVSALKNEEYFVSFKQGLLTMNLAELEAAGVDIAKFYSEEDFEVKRGIGQ